MNKSPFSILQFLAFVSIHCSVIAETIEIEEVVITSQKRVQLLQKTPVAATVITANQLDIRGINGLDTLSRGEVPSLRIMPFGNSPSTKVVTIRGNGPLDIAQVTLEPSVALYLDGIYLGRGHGLSTEYADLEQVEVLRGPQGTMFGRNAIGGAIKLVSKKPTGEFQLKQTLGMGKFDEFRSVTTINFPKIAGLSAKFDYLHAQRDGWVKNRNHNESDFNAYDKNGGRLSIDWQISDTFSANYSYDQSDVKVTQNYFQMYRDDLGAIGVEKDRVDKNRRPVLLDPTTNEQTMHGLTLNWLVSDSFSIKSISSYREMDEETNNNYDGALYFNGLIAQSFIEQEQVSQELQLIGNTDQIERVGQIGWVIGAYYYKEQADEILHNLFTRDISGCITGTANASIPVTNVFNEGCGPAFNEFTALPRDISANTTSEATYAHLAWTPPFNENLKFNIGLRNTQDSKEAQRRQFGFNEKDVGSSFLSRSFSAQYDITDNIMAYISRNTGYKAGGVNSRSINFESFDEEKNKTYELGLKADLFNNSVNLYSAVFKSKTDGRQITVSHPTIPGLTAQINADEEVDSSGFETELQWRPTDHISFGASYTYLDSNRVLHSNPLASGAPQQLEITQSPEHSGALWIDYNFQLWNDIHTAVHVDATATDKFSFVASGEQLQRGFELFNAKVIFDVPIFKQAVPMFKQAGPTFKQNVKVVLWANNILDKEYLVFTRSQGANAEIINQVFGDPRTYGVSFKIEI